MKLNRLETHDRLLHFTKQHFDIAECCQDLIKQRPFGHHPFYIFVHPRTDDDGIRKRLIWQPRLTKPLAQTNSMLFKGYPGSDYVKIIWMIPPREIWAQFEKGKMTENETVWNSIQDFIYRREELESPEHDDPTDQEVLKIYRQTYDKKPYKKI